MKYLAISLQIVTSVVLALTATIIRFQNPQLTETQLFLHLVQDYWWMFVLFIVVQVFAAFVNEREKVRQ